MTDRSSPSHEEYLEANRLHREGFLPVSNKYRRAIAPPPLPPDSELLALLKQLDPRAYERILQEIRYVVARVVGEREVQLEPLTYVALKTIKKEEMIGRITNLQRERGGLPNRIIEIRYADPQRAPVMRNVRIDSPYDEHKLVKYIVNEELAKFDDATIEARADFDVGVEFLRTKGIRVVLLSVAETELRRREILFGKQESDDDIEGDDP
jgi:hypothetical protein